MYLCTTINARSNAQAQSPASPAAAPGPACVVRQLNLTSKHTHIGGLTALPMGFTTGGRCHRHHHHHHHYAISSSLCVPVHEMRKLAAPSIIHCGVDIIRTVFRWTGVLGVAIEAGLGYQVPPSEQTRIGSIYFVHNNSIATFCH